jgi:alcohol dehydrogenase
MMLAPSGSRVVLPNQTFLFGADAAGSRLRTELRDRGWSRIVLLASGSMTRSGQRHEFMTGVLDGLDVHVVDVPIAGHAPIADTERIAESLRGVDVDAIVALGGGSVSDTAKGVAILMAEGGRLEDHCSVFTPPDVLHSPVMTAPKVPVVVVPTTLSGAEVTPGGGATNADRVKRTFWDPQVAARVIAFDPSLLRTVPIDVLVTTGMNGLAHCAEGLYSRTANPISTAFAVAGARNLANGLRRLTSGDTSNEAFDELAAGAALGGLVIANARVGLHHAICHVLGARAGIPHGVANSIMLPNVLRYNQPQTEAAQRALATAIDPESAAPASEVVDALRVRVGAPRSLREAGLRADDLPSVAAGTMQDRGLFFNPRTVADQNEVLRLLEQAW